jgi:hypothetical protein
VPLKVLIPVRTWDMHESRCDHTDNRHTNSSGKYDESIVRLPGPQPIQASTSTSQWRVHWRKEISDKSPPYYHRRYAASPARFRRWRDEGSRRFGGTETMGGWGSVVSSLNGDPELVPSLTLSLMEILSHLSLVVARILSFLLVYIRN